MIFHRGCFIQGEVGAYSPGARHCIENSTNYKYFNFQFRNTDDSTCNNDKSLSFSPSRIAFPTGSTNNFLLPYGWEQKGIPIQNCVSTKVAAKQLQKQMHIIQHSCLPNTVSSSYLTNKCKSTEHKLKHFRLLPCFSVETTTKPNRIKNNSCKAKYQDSVRVETMLFVVNKITDKHLHPSHGKTRRV